MTLTPELLGLIQNLKQVRSPVKRMKVLARAWKTFQGLDLTTRREVARRLGLRGFEKVAASIGTRGGLEPEEVDQLLDRVEGLDPSKTSELIRALRSPSGRKELARKGMAALTAAMAKPGAGGAGEGPEGAADPAEISRTGTAPASTRTATPDRAPGPRPGDQPSGPRTPSPSQAGQVAAAAAATAAATRTAAGRPRPAPSAAARSEAAKARVPAAAPLEAERPTGPGSRPAESRSREAAPAEEEHARGSRQDRPRSHAPAPRRKEPGDDLPPEIASTPPIIPPPASKVLARYDEAGPEREKVVRPDPSRRPARAPELDDLIRRMRSSRSLAGRLRAVRDHLEAGGELDGPDSREALSSLPEGWPRRRALAAILACGQPAEFDQALSLVSEEMDAAGRGWCLTALARGRRLSGAQVDRLARLAGSPRAARRLRSLQATAR